MTAREDEPLSATEGRHKAAGRQDSGGAALGQAYATFVVHQRKAAGKATEDAAKRERAKDGAGARKL